MKRTALAVILLGTLGMILPSRPALAQGSVTVSIGTFYDELSPHGEWIDCSYGECWVPRGVAQGWQPYSNGEWIYTRYGWTWVSNDPWGGDPYHYGTWAFIGRYGWVWVPGTVWAPAWVTWNYGNSYVGWAPMPPNVAFGRSGYSGRAVVVSESQYVFVPTNRFVGTSISSVRVEPRRNAEIFRQGKSVTRFDVSEGIVRNMALPMATVSKATAGGIQTREISSAHTAPRTLSSGVVGKAGHVGIVAPASEVKAARASHNKAATPHATVPEAQPQAKPQQAKLQPQQHEQAKPQQAQQAKPQPQQHEQAKPQQAQQAKPQPQQHEQAKPQQAQQAKAQPQQHEQAKPQPQQQAQPQQQQAQPQQQHVQPQQQHVQPQQQHAQPQQQQAQPQQQHQAQPQQQEQGKPGKRELMVQDQTKPPQPTPPSQPTQPPQPTPTATAESDTHSHPDHPPALRPAQPQQVPQRSAPPAQEKGKDDSAGNKGQPAKDEPPK